MASTKRPEANSAGRGMSQAISVSRFRSRFCLRTSR
jgi:hypothetical protein